MHAYDEQTRFSGMLYVLMLIVVVVFAAFVWQMFGGVGDAPRISAPPGAYKMAPPRGADTALDLAEENAMYAALEGRAETGAVTPAPAPEAPAVNDARTPTGAPRIAPDPAFVRDGPFVAQLAALQSEAAVQPAWARLASRAPALFARADLDVERADLGARGVYYRVRAGYFADRDNANRFCDRIEQMGQDCIVVSR